MYVIEAHPYHLRAFQSDFYGGEEVIGVHNHKQNIQFGFLFYMCAVFGTKV
jgi:hypothetical protein